MELVSPPEVTGQQDSNATVTALAAFANCPRQYYLGHYLGFEGRPRKLAEAEEVGGLSAGELGTQVHALLAGSPVPEPDEEALRLAEVFRQSPLGRRLARASRVEREFDFLMAVEDLVIRGQVDLWFEEGGRAGDRGLQDRCRHRRGSARRAQDYALQLRLYALAVERFAGRAPDRAWLHFLRPNTVVEVDLTPSLLEPPEQIVRDFEEAQSKLEFPLNEGETLPPVPVLAGFVPGGAGVAHSFRKADIGSVNAARLAGSQAADTTTTARMAAAANSTRGSPAWMPNTRPSAVLASAAAPAAPTTNPIPATSATSRSTRLRMSPFPAPMAMRIPISPVRLVTSKLSSPYSPTAANTRASTPKPQASVSIKRS